MLDTLAPTDPILLLAIVDGPFSSLPRDVRAWFGPARDNRIAFESPTPSQREHFFNGLLSDVQRPPNAFADGVKRKKRVLEVLPIAPPLEPRQPTAAELSLQEENDQRVITLLKYRLGPILTELKRKFKRFTKRARVSFLYFTITKHPILNLGCRRSMILKHSRTLTLKLRLLRRQLKLSQGPMASSKSLTHNGQWNPPRMVLMVCIMSTLGKISQYTRSRSSRC